MVATIRIGVFAKPPVAGLVKTRLSPCLPPDLAARLHAAMVGDALEAAVEAGADQVILFWAALPPGDPAVALPSGIETRVQRGPDLGARLAASFAELLAEGAARAVVIGTDCPDLGPDALRHAMAALATSDLVLGPARDGGYYLIGLRHPAPALFAGIEWGSSRVLEHTRRRARDLGLREHLLEIREDIDTPADLVRLIARRSVENAITGLRTESALREMGLLPTCD